MNKKIKIKLNSKIRGTSERPRLAVFRSNKYLYAQIIDDAKGETLVGISIKSKKIDTAKGLGVSLAKKALDKKIKSVVFDRRTYSYHGRIKSLAEGAREGGLKF